MFNESIFRKLIKLIHKIHVFNLVMCKCDSLPRTIHTFARIHANTRKYMTLSPQEDQRLFCSFFSNSSNSEQVIFLLRSEVVKSNFSVSSKDITITYTRVQLIYQLCINTNHEKLKNPSKFLRTRF